MKVRTSVCSHQVFQDSQSSIGAFRAAAEYFAEKGLRKLEFYYDGPQSGKLGGILADNGLAGGFTAVAELKAKHRNLCGLDADDRAEALAISERLMDLTADNGFESVMFNSGRIEPGREAEQLDFLFASLEEIFNYAARRGYGFCMEMEPCASNMDSRQLIGPYARARAFFNRLHAAGLPLMVTLDAAHVAEEGEDFLESLRALRPYCEHLHYANCYIADPSHPMFGDQHLSFDYPGGHWSYEKFGALTEAVAPLYPGDAGVQICIEAMCREADPAAWFDRLWENVPYLRGN